MSPVIHSSTNQLALAKRKKEEYIYRLSSLVRNCFKVLNVNRKMGTWGGNITPECTNLKFQTNIPKTI